MAPKSNAAYKALGAARAYVREHGAATPPPYLRSPPDRSGPAYDYPHDNPGHLTRQQLLPDAVVGQRFYLPDEREEALRERLEAWRRWREKRD
jgi:putative ATPase